VSVAACGDGTSLICIKKKKENIRHVVPSLTIVTMHFIVVINIAVVIGEC